MQLLPIIDEYAGDEIEQNQSSLVHFIKDTENIQGEVDGINSVKQACFCILATEQKIHPIYEENYGIETFDLIGKDYSYIASELKRRIIEALKTDERITDVKDFIINKVDKDSINIGFVVETIFGNISMEKTVNLVQGDSL